MSAERLFLQIAALPPRPREIHASPCKNCPSAHFPPDAECVEIKECHDRASQVESAFPCAWRPEKLCKGYCDYLNITEGDLK